MMVMISHAELCSKYQDGDDDVHADNVHHDHHGHDDDKIMIRNIS